MIGVIGILGCGGLIVGSIIVIASLASTGYQMYQAHEARDEAKANAKRMQRLQHRQEHKAEVQAKGQRKLEDRVLKVNEDKMRRQVASSIAYQSLKTHWADLERQRAVQERVDIPDRNTAGRRGYGRGGPVSGA